jgi:hypothetical protein
VVFSAVCINSDLRPVPSRQTSASMATVDLPAHQNPNEVESPKTAPEARSVADRSKTFPTHLESALAKKSIKTNNFNYL